MKVFILKWKIIRSNNFFFKKNKYAVFHLNQNKINTKHSSVQIILEAIDEKTCFLVTLIYLYTRDF